MKVNKNTQPGRLVSRQIQVFNFAWIINPRKIKPVQRAPPRLQEKVQLLEWFYSICRRAQESLAPSPILHCYYFCPLLFSLSPSVFSISQRNYRQSGDKYLNFCLQTYVNPLLPLLKVRSGMSLLVQDEFLLDLNPLFP